MAKCHWPQSMTKIYGQNFEKNVIDHCQWQKNCHLLKGIYPNGMLTLYHFQFTSCKVTWVMKYRRNTICRKHIRQGRTDILPRGGGAAYCFIIRGAQVARTESVGVLLLLRAPNPSHSHPLPGGPARQLYKDRDKGKGKVMTKTIVKYCQQWVVTQLTHSIQHNFHRLTKKCTRFKND